MVGIRGHDESGTAVTERARVVIGADGHNSRIARLVEAPSYHDKSILENAFYTFWSGLPVDRMRTVIREDRGFAAIPTNEDQTLVLVGCPFAHASHFRKDLENNYLEALRRDPEWADLIADATREADFVGGGVPNFFRKPFGPGWVLVGDAGYTKDPITAQGIANAFDQAELAAAALHAVWAGERSFDNALGDVQRVRDEGCLPVYEFTTQLATLEPPPPEMQRLFGGLAASQAGMNAFVSLNAGTMSPVEFFDPDHLDRVLQPTSGVTTTPWRRPWPPPPPGTTYSRSAVGRRRTKAVRRATTAGEATGDQPERGRIVAANWTNTTTTAAVHASVPRCPRTRSTVVSAVRACRWLISAEHARGR